MAEGQALPKQIRDQIRETKKLETAIRKEIGAKRMGTQSYVRSVDSPTNPAQNEDSSAGAPPDTSTGPEAPVAEDSSSEATAAPPEPPSTEGPSTEGAPEAAELPSTPSAESAPEPWEERYRSLQGKYNAEVPRMASELSEATRLIQDLQNQVASLQAPQAAPEPESEPEPAYTPFGQGEALRPGDTEDYGAEMIDFVTRAARDVAREPMAKMMKQIGRLEKQLSDLQQTTSQVSQKQARNEVMTTNDYLDAHAGGWRELNTDANFNAWLRNPDPFSGMPRMQLLHDAYNAGDGERTARFFNAYKQEHETLSAAAQGQGSPRTVRTPSVDVETLATPSPTAGAEQPAPAQSEAQPKGQEWTDALIAQFYTDVRRGLFRGRESEQRAIEADIHAATTDGRYKPQ